MSLEDKLLIGTEMTVKPDCDFSLLDYEMNYGNMIREAGPKPSSWRFDGVAVALQIAAPKVIALQIEGQSKRIPETTVKEFAWQKWTSRPERANPGILNNYYGVEISNCTGNARRVPLKEILLMPPIQKLLQRQIPGWISTTWGADFMKALQTESDNAVFQFWTKHAAERAKVGQLVSCVLDVLHDTGCTGTELQAAFLHQDRESIITIDSKANDWVMLLKDSYLTASYAIINQVCLEYKSPDHSTCICNPERRHSVLRTEVGLDHDGEIRKHVRIQPHGLLFEKANKAVDDLLPPCFLTPKSALTSIFRWRERPSRARELVNQSPSIGGTRNGVVLRSLEKSFGGMPRQRKRGLGCAIAEADGSIIIESMNEVAMQEAQLQLEIEAPLWEDLQNQDAEESQRAHC